MKKLSFSQRSKRIGQVLLTAGLLWLSEAPVEAQQPTREPPPQTRKKALPVYPLKAAKPTENVRIALPTIYNIVLENHPIARQVRLLPEMARQEIRMAKGLFDPTIDLHFNRKRLWNYKENWAPTTYYQNQDHFIKFPFWIGDIKVGTERYTGLNVNPENFTPQQGLSYILFNIPIGRNMLLDERRNMLLQSKYIPQLNQAEKIKIINKLLLQVTKDYWAWYEAYQKFSIAKDGLELAELRYQMTKENVKQGDAAPIDSIEARSEILKRRIAQQEATVDFKNATLILSNHLWEETGQPLELGPQTIPGDDDIEIQPLNSNTLDSLRALAQEAHPELTKLRVKMAQFDIEERFRRQELLPKIDIDFKPFFIHPTNDPKYPLQPNYLTWEYLSENYKIGLNLYMPLFLRKERSKLALTQLKIEQLRFDMQQSQRTVDNELEAFYNELEYIGQMLRTQRQSIELLQTLLEAENERFRNGESSLFLINSRERSLITEQSKLVELQNKYAKAQMSIYWATGIELDQWLTKGSN
jgi:outer membrane protein TolC